MRFGYITDLNNMMVVGSEERFMVVQEAEQLLHATPVRLLQRSDYFLVP